MKATFHAYPLDLQYRLRKGMKPQRCALCSNPRAHKLGYLVWPLRAGSVGMDGLKACCDRCLTKELAHKERQ